MVTVGDWIEMPEFAADGDVVDVSLTTVKVQNWDKTITSIPAYALISHPFKNWRGMSDSGGRRIKRALNIDMNTIKFVDHTMLERFQKIQLIQDYLNDKLLKIKEHNQQVAPNDSGVTINGRRLTNVGTFRAYCRAYLRQHPRVHQDMTLLVRQLAPAIKDCQLNSIFSVMIPSGRIMRIYNRIYSTIWSRLFLSLNSPFSKNPALKTFKHTWKLIICKALIYINL